MDYLTPTCGNHSVWRACSSRGIETTNEIGIVVLFHEVKIQKRKASGFVKRNIHNADFFAILGFVNIFPWNTRVFNFSPTISGHRVFRPVDVLVAWIHGKKNQAKSEPITPRQLAEVTNGNHHLVLDCSPFGLDQTWLAWKNSDLQKVGAFFLKKKDDVLIIYPEEMTNLAV